MISEFLDWLASREALFSALAALAAIIGISYGMLSFLFPSLGRAMRRRLARSDQDESPQAAGTVPVPGPPAAAGKSSIAVLPLRALSNDENDRNIAAGISAEITADLAQLPDLRVSSHLATLGFRQGDVDLKKVAEVLSIRYVLTGSFQHHGNRIRLTAELTDAHTGDQLWASTYDRELEDLFEVQGEVSEAIVGAIGGELKLADTRIAYDAPTERLDAWGLVQKAYNFWLTSFTPEDYEKSLALLRKAVKIDPGYAGARASLAMILSQRAINGLSGEDFEKDRAEALEMIEEALKLEPNGITVLENAGLVWTHHGHALRARETLRRAVELAPLDLIAWGYLGYNLGWTGTGEEVEEAVAILNRLLTIAPKHPSTPYWHYFMATTLARTDRLEEAIEEGRLVLDKQPAFYLTWFHLANIFGRLGQIEKAAEALGKARSINPCMTVDFYAERVRANVDSDDIAEAFLSGLRRAGLLEAA